MGALYDINAISQSPCECSQTVECDSRSETEVCLLSNHDDRYEFQQVRVRADAGLARPGREREVKPQASEENDVLDEERRERVVKKTGTVVDGRVRGDLSVYPGASQSCQAEHQEMRSSPSRCDGHSSRKWLALAAMIATMSFGVAGTLANVL